MRFIADLWEAVVRRRDSVPVGCEVESTVDTQPRTVDVVKVGPVNAPLSTQPWQAAEPVPEPESPHVEYCAATSRGAVCALPKGHGVLERLRHMQVSHAWYLPDFPYYGPRRGPEPARYGVAACPDCKAELRFGMVHACGEPARQPSQSALLNRGGRRPL